MKVNRSDNAALKLRPEDMRVFAAIGRARTLTEAADQLKMPLFTVSRALKRIEGSAQVVLVRRDGSGLRLTELGQEYLLACHSALQAHQAATDVLFSRQTEPDGMLHIGAPVTFTQEVLSHILVDFLRSFPKLRVELSLCSDSSQEPKASHDVFLKAGAPSESRHHMKLFPPIRQGLFASPEYLTACPRPMHPLDLQHHDCLGIGPGGNQFTWAFSHGNERLSVHPSARITVADPATLSRLALNSAGITMLPVWLAREHVNTGNLVEVLPDWIPDPAVFCALYRGRPSPSSKEGAFLSFLTSVLGGTRDPRCKGCDPRQIFVHNESAGIVLLSSAEKSTAISAKAN